MMIIKSAKIRKFAQEKRKLEPWELTEEQQRDFEPIGELATEEDFRPPAVAPEPAPEPLGEDVFEIKPRTEHTFLPFAPIPDKDKMPINPVQFIGEEVPIPTTPIEDANEDLNIREKIFYSLNNSTPMRVNYTTLEGGTTTERIIHPDYVYWAGTNRHILVAWDETKNDWRAFSVDNISMADLMEQEQQAETAWI